MKTVITVLIAFIIGVLASYIPLRSKISRCEADNATLTADLRRAVVRGVSVEAQLIMCQEREGKK